MVWKSILGAGITIGIQEMQKGNVVKPNQSNCCGNRLYSVWSDICYSHICYLYLIIEDSMWDNAVCSDPMQLKSHVMWVKRQCAFVGNGSHSVCLAKCLHSNKNRQNLLKKQAGSRFWQYRPNTNIQENFDPFVIFRALFDGGNLGRQKSINNIADVFQLFVWQVQPDMSEPMKTCCVQTRDVSANVCPATPGAGSKPRQSLRSAAPITLSCSKPNRKWDSLNLHKSCSNWGL